MGCSKKEILACELVPGHVHEGMFVSRVRVKCVTQFREEGMSHDRILHSNSDRD